VRWAGFGEELSVPKWLRPVVMKFSNQRYHCGKGSLPEADIAYLEKRRSPRYSFIASAELIEVKADVRIVSRVSELSLHGCYLDMMNPFPRERRCW